MPGRTQLSAEAIRHIATGEIGIRAAKSRYGIGEQRVRRIRQGLEVARDDATPAEAQDQQDEDNAAILREAIEHAQAEAKQARDDADRLRAEAAQLREKQEADTDRILELEAKYDNLAYLQHKTICKLAERKALEEQHDEDTAAILREAEAEVEQARAEAKQARDEADRLRAEAAQLREKQPHQSTRQENRPATQQKSKKRAARSARRKK